MQMQIHSPSDPTMLQKLAANSVGLKNSFCVKGKQFDGKTNTWMEEADYAIAGDALIMTSIFPYKDPSVAIIGVPRGTIIK